MLAVAIVLLAAVALVVYLVIKTSQSFKGIDIAGTLILLCIVGIILLIILRVAYPDQFYELLTRVRSWFGQ